MIQLKKVLNGVMVLGLFLIIFISTPMVIMKTLKSISEKNINLHFMENIPFLEKVSSLLPTLTTVAINLALILLIDHSAVTEKHSTHSTFQSAIFNKAIIYLHLNMVFFPFLSLQGQPIFLLLKTKQVPTEYIRQFTMINTSSFFVNLMIQYGVFTSLLYFLRLGDLFSNHFSPTLADTRRKFLNNGQHWRRTPDWVFQYGFFSCQMVTIFTIGMLFSFISPIVTFGCIVFYLIRNMVDSYLLLTVHKKECESKLFLFHKVLIWCLGSVLFYQVFIFVYFYLNSLLFQTIIVGVLMLLTIGLILVFTVQVLDPLRMVKIYLEEEEVAGLSFKVKETNFTRTDFEKWREVYSHPLLKGNAINNLSIFHTDYKMTEDVHEMMRQFSNEFHDEQDSGSFHHYKNRIDSEIISEIELEDHINQDPIFDTKETNEHNI